MIWRTRKLLTLIAAVLASAPAAASAAPGDYRIEYDWAGVPGTGFTGIGSFSIPADGTAGYQTPYYRTDRAPGAGLAFRPVPASDGTRDRVYPLPPSDGPDGGVRTISLIEAPGTTRIRSARFSAFRYRREQGEQQFLRFAVYGPGADGVYDTRPDAPPPGPYLNDQIYDDPNASITVPFPGGAAGETVQTWFFTSCDSSCPTVGFEGPQAEPRSYADLGRIEVELRDPEPPAIELAGPLTASAGWTNGRDLRSARIVVRDPGSGVRRLQVERRRPGSGSVQVLDAQADCDRSHTGAGASGRSAAPCPDVLERTLTQDLAGLAEGEYTYTATATDDSDRTTQRTFVVRIDRTAPTADLQGAIRRLPRDWTRRTDAVPAALLGRDAASGVAALDLYVREPGGERLIRSLAVCGAGASDCPRRREAPVGVPLGELRDGEIEVFARARDLAANVSQASPGRPARLDRTPPRRVTVRTPVLDRGRLQVGWRRLARDGGSPVTRYRVEVTDASTFRTLVRPVIVDDARDALELRLPRGVDARSGRVAVRAVDRAGNVSPYADRAVSTRRIRRSVRTRRTARRPARPSGPRQIEFGFSDGNWDITSMRTPAGRRPITRLDTIVDLRDRIARYARRNPRTLRQRFLALRIVAPFDLWSQPEDARFRKGFEAFRTAVQRYNATPGVLKAQVYVSLNGHNFDRCIGAPDPGRPNADVQEIGYSPRPEDNARACVYPTRDAFKSYFTDWIAKTRDLPVTHWAAWNEPDSPTFTLGALPRVQAGARAAEYWLAAQEVLTSAPALCQGCSVLAGEFSGYVAEVIQGYEEVIAAGIRAGAAPPRRWSIHAYGDTYQGDARRDTTRNFIDLLRSRAARDRLGDFKVWITETGIQLRYGAAEQVPNRARPGSSVTDYKETPLNGRATDQFIGGRDFLRVAQSDPSIERVYYYGAWADPDKFDSHLVDGAGEQRPGTCGIAGDRRLDRVRCRGSASAPRNPPPTPTPTPTPGATP